MEIQYMLINNNVWIVLWLAGNKATVQVKTKKVLLIDMILTWTYFIQYLTTRVWKQLLGMLYNGGSKTYGCIAWIMLVLTTSLNTVHR